MREQKNSLSKFIWMIFVASIFADISKSAEESLEELVGTLKSNFNVAEAFRSNPASIRYTALRLLGKNVLIGDLLNIHQTLCNVKKPEFVTIITATRKLDHARDTTTNSYMTNFISGIQRLIRDGNETWIGDDGLTLTVHEVKGVYQKYHDVFCLNTNITEMIDRKIFLSELNSFIKYMYDVLVIEYMRKMHTLMLRLIYDALKPLKKKKELSHLNVERIYDNFITEFIAIIPQDNFRYTLQELYRQYFTKKGVFNDTYKQIFDYEKKRKIICYSGKEDNLYAFISCVRQYIERNTWTSEFRGIHQELIRQNYDLHNRNAFSQTFTLQCHRIYSVMKSLDSKYLSTFDKVHEYFRKPIYFDPFCHDFQLAFSKDKLFDSMQRKVSELRLFKFITQDKNDDKSRCTRIVFGAKLDSDKLHSLAHILYNTNAFDTHFDDQIYIIDDQNTVSSQTVALGIDKVINDKTDMFSSRNHFERREGVLEIFLTSEIQKSSAKNATKEIISLKYDCGGIISGSGLKNYAIDRYINATEIIIERFVGEEYQKALDGNIVNVIATILAQSSSLLLSTHKILLKHKDNFTNEDCIYVIAHKQASGDMRYMFSVIFDVEAITLNKIDSHMENKYRRIKILNDVSPHYLERVIGAIQILQLTTTAFTIPEYFSTSESSLCYAHKKLKSGLQPERGCRKLLRNLQKIYYKDIYGNFYSFDDEKNGFAVCNRIGTSNAPNFTVFDKTSYSEFKQIINKFMLVDQYEFTLLDNFHSYSGELFCEFEQVLYEMNAEEGSTILHLFSKQRKNYTFLSFCNDQTRLFLALIKIYECNEKFMKHFILDRFTKIAFSKLINELLEIRLYDSSQLNMRDRLEKKAKEMILMIRSFILPKHAIFSFKRTRGGDQSVQKPAECQIYNLVIKPMMIHYVKCICAKVYNLTWEDDINLTTIMITKTKSLKLQKGIEGASDDSGYATIDNFKSLEAYEESIIDVLTKSYDNRIKEQ